MSWYSRLVRPLLFRFDAERVHEIGLRMIARGWVRGPLVQDPVLERTLWGVRFPNLLGLAAGFDKNAVAVHQWHRLGFGFVEIGTVTAHAQPGNPRPRLFRLPEDEAVVNRLGFNNQGHAAIAERLRRARSSIPIGVNLGKSKVTELADAAQDYATSFQSLRKLGQYAVVNVSSPNTAGLRSLQERDALTEILVRLREIDVQVPLLVKVAPDLSDEALADVVQVAREQRIAGLIATNTTLSREGLRFDPQQDGGLSGRPLKSRADRTLELLAQEVRGEMALIGVGGVFSGADLADKVRLGADLVQAYTGFIYGGPGFAGRVLMEYLQLAMRADG